MSAPSTARRCSPPTTTSVRPSRRHAIAPRIGGPGEIVTTIEPLGDFFRAEEYHQDFFAKNPGQGYCMAVALPKVTKIRRSYADYVLA